MKKRKVTLSSKARAYINAEAKYLRHRSHSGAEKFLALMRLARTDLADFPKLGLGKDGLPYGDFRLYFAGPTFLTMRSVTTRCLSFPSGMDGNWTRRFLWTRSPTKKMTMKHRPHRVPGVDNGNCAIPYRA